MGQENAIAVTAGASAPENVVQAVCDRLRELGIDTVVLKMASQIDSVLVTERTKLRVVD